MGRELRMVPANWQHPEGYRGKYRPLHGGSYSADAAKWHESYLLWAKGEHPRQKESPPPDFLYYWEYSGSPPDEDEYMPDWPVAERTHFMMYEDTSEGTPISPAFATAEDLARWLADNEASAFADDTATYEEWLATIKRGWALSAVSVNGGPIQSGVSAMADADKTPP